MEHKAVRFQLYVLRYNVNRLVLDSHQQFTGYVHVTITSTRHMEVTLYNGSGWKMNQYKPWTKYRKTIQQILKGGVLHSVTCWWFWWCSKPRNLSVMSRMLYQLSYRTMYRGHITLSMLLCRMLLSITLRIAPFLKVYWLIILKHFITSFCLLNYYITTVCCCQALFLIIVL